MMSDVVQIKPDKELTVEQAIRFIADGWNLLDPQKMPFPEGPWHSFSASVRWDGESLFIDELTLTPSVKS